MTNLEIKNIQDMVVSLNNDQFLVVSLVPGNYHNDAVCFFKTFDDLYSSSWGSFGGDQFYQNKKDFLISISKYLKEKEVTKTEIKTRDMYSDFVEHSIPKKVNDGDVDLNFSFVYCADSGESNPLAIGCKFRFDEQKQKYLLYIEKKIKKNKKNFLNFPPIYFGEEQKYKRVLCFSKKLVEDFIGKAKDIKVEYISILDEFNVSQNCNYMDDFKYAFKLYLGPIQSIAYILEKQYNIKKERDTSLLNLCYTISALINQDPLLKAYDNLFSDLFFAIFDKYTMKRKISNNINVKKELPSIIDDGYEFAGFYKENEDSLKITNELLKHKDEKSGEVMYRS